MNRAHLIRHYLFHGPQRLSTLAEMLATLLPYPRAEASRLGAALESMERQGFVERRERGWYALTARGHQQVLTETPVCEVCGAHPTVSVWVVAETNPITTRVLCAACNATYNTVTETTP